LLLTIFSVSFHQIIPIKIEIEEHSCDDKHAFLFLKVILHNFEEMVLADKRLIADFGVGKGTDPQY
jgi:hypothetical protein